MNPDSTSADEARMELYEIMQRNVEFEEKARAALELGERYLGVDNAHLTRIDEDTDLWEAIVSTDPPDGSFPPGLSLDYRTTYCRRVLEEGSSVALHDAPDQGWADDPAFEAHGLHCYHGTPIMLGEETFGTVCFVSKNPREAPFDESETLFAELVARLLEHELERTRKEEEITLRSNSITVLSRVLRHNLRNEMSVVRGRVSLLLDELDDQRDPGPDEDLLESIDRIIDLSDKARKLESVVSTRFDREPIALDALLDRLTTTVATDYPDADVTVEGATGITFEAMPSLELALTELVDNAATHAGDDPTVTVRVEATPEAVDLHVIDDGPGLPEQEREVLDEGVETPLIHGSGLGLWMVYWIVSNHDGSIDTTVTEAGTTVTVTLPRGNTEARTTEDQTVRVLQRGRDRFEAVFEESFDAMVLVNDDREVIHANEHAADTFGGSRTDLLGLPLDEFAGPSFDLGEAWLELQGTGTQTGEFPLVRPDGTERIVEYSATADIVPGQHLVIARDVTERKQRQAELERYETIVENINDSAWVYDEDKRITFANQELLDRLSMERDQLVGTSLSAFEGFFVESDTFDAWERLVEDTLAGTTEREELDVAFEIDGERVVANLSLAPLPDPDDPTGVVVIARDITERKQREAKLRSQVVAMDSAPIGITMADPSRDDNPLVYANDTFCELTGYDEDEVLGRNCRFLQGPETDPEAARKIRRAIEDREPVTVTLRNYRTDGSEFWNRLRIAPVEDEDGTLTRFVGFQEDVTERIEREERLEVAETVFQNTQDALFLVDVRGDCEFYVQRVNAVYEEVTGLSDAEITGKTPREVVGDELGREIESQYCECVERQETIQYREEIPVDGEHREWETKLTPVVDDGTVTNLVGAMRDVTQE